MAISKEQIDKINELAHLAKERDLTPTETMEREELRKAYIAAFRENLKAQLDAIEIVDPADEEKVEEELTEAAREVVEAEAFKNRVH